MSPCTNIDLIRFSGSLVLDFFLFCFGFSESDSRMSSLVQTVGPTERTSEQAKSEPTFTGLACAGLTCADPNSAGTTCADSNCDPTCPVFTCARPPQRSDGGPFSRLITRQRIAIDRH